MDILRREASGELAAILGRSMLEHDRVQRTLQIGAAADKAITALPADQKHWLEEYARGVNASIAAQLGHLPVEFRVLGYQPAQWTPRDSILVELAMFQELTTGFPEKLNREALAAHLSPELMADLYPTGSWRDHYPGQPMPDISAPQPIFEDVPLDESQSKLHPPAGSGTPSIPRSMRNGLIHPACYQRPTLWRWNRPSRCSTRRATLALPDRTRGPSPARALLPESRCSPTTCTSI